MIQDFIHRTIPIGLRVVRKIDELTYIASEDPITEEHVKMMREMASHPPKELSIGDDELIPEASEEVREDVRQLYI